MLRRRLQRLAALTQGLALVGVGACNNPDSPPHEPPHINSPYNPDAAASLDTTTDAAPVALAKDAAAPDEFRPPHTINAPPPGFKPVPPPRPSAKP